MSVTPVCMSKEQNLFTVAELEAEIFKIMLELGVSPNLRGFRYLNDAIKIVYYDPGAGNNIVEGLYNRLAGMHDTNVKCIEHSIRTALRRSASSDNRAAFNKYFNIEKCPTAKKFINLLSARLRSMEQTK